VINVYIVLFQGRETLQNSYHLFNIITIDWAKCKTRSLTVQAMTINYQVEILPYSVIFIFLFSFFKDYIKFLLFNKRCVSTLAW